MFSFNIIPDQTGFRYSLSSNEEAWYKFDYLAICAGGHQVYGQQAGSTTGPGIWVSVKTDAPVIHVGVSGMQFDKYEIEPGYQGTCSSEIKFDRAEAVYIPDAAGFKPYNVLYDAYLNESADGYLPAEGSFRPYAQSFNSYLPESSMSGLYDAYDTYGAAFAPYSAFDSYGAAFAPYGAFDSYCAAFDAYGAGIAPSEAGTGFSEEVLAPYGTFNPY